MRTLLTPPEIEPVALAEMRAFIGIKRADDTARDAQITAHIKEARILVESIIKKSLIDTVFIESIDSFSDRIYLQAPLRSVTSIKYLDSANVLQTLSPSVYYVDVFSSIVWRDYGQSWPVTSARANNIQIQYVAGFSDEGAGVPENIKGAIKWLVSHWEGFQKSVEGGRLSTVPYAVQEMLKNDIDYRGYFA